MAVLTREQFNTAIRGIVGERTDDEALTFVENMNDTFNDAESRASDTTNWKKKYEDNDRDWRNRYRERFFNGGKGDEGNKDNEEDEDKDEGKVKTYNDLFKEVK